MIQLIAATKADRTMTKDQFECTFKGTETKNYTRICLIKTFPHNLLSCVVKV